MISGAGEISDLLTYDLFPFPVEVYAADGTEVFINRACLELYGMEDSNILVGKYNLLKDPEYNDSQNLIKTIKRAFSGEAVTIPEYRPPVKDLADRGVIMEKPYESVVTEAFLSPVSDKGKLIFVVCVYIVRNIFRGKPEVAKAKEYIRERWRGKFDPQSTAKALNISVTHLYRLFKQYAGMTPGDFHRQCKIDRIKEKLSDKSLSVREAFLACGENNRGWTLKVFKEITGVTPVQWRRTQLWQQT